jgi:hypothetical protein
MNLQEIAKEVKETIIQKQKEFGLEFFEEEHKYYMKDLDGTIKSDFPSVSKVLKCFYEEFDSETISYRKSGGDPDEQERLLKEWADAGDYATNMGSRTHFILEQKSLDMFGIQKEVRQPIFECDILQIQKSDSMVQAGEKFLKLMKDRGAVLIDTEMTLGSPELGYTGTPDKLWVMENKEKNGIIFFTTDYKTNKPKNFIPTRYTKKMKAPFQLLDDTALSHYFIQLPLYGKLMMNMLKGTKYEDVSFAGGVVVLLKDDSDYVEYRIPKEVIATTMGMNVKDYLTKKK